MGVCKVQLQVRTYKGCQLELYSKDQSARDCGSSGGAASSRCVVVRPFPSPVSGIMKTLTTTSVTTKSNHDEYIRKDK